MLSSSFFIPIFASICFLLNSILVHCTFCADVDAGSAAEGDERAGAGWSGEQ